MFPSTRCVTTLVSSTTLIIVRKTGKLYRIANCDYLNLAFSEPNYIQIDCSQNCFGNSERYLRHKT